MHDKNQHISAMCNACLDIIGAHSEEWAERTKLERFRFHNSQWLEMVENSSSDLGLAGEEDDLPDYQSNLLDNSLVHSGHNVYSENYQLDRHELEASPNRHCSTEDPSFACHSSSSSSDDLVLVPRLLNTDLLS